MVLLTSFDFDYISGSRRFLGSRAQNLFSLKCVAYLRAARLSLMGTMCTMYRDNCCYRIDTLLCRRHHGDESAIIVRVTGGD